MYMLYIYCIYFVYRIAQDILATNVIDTNNGNGVQPKGHKKRDSIDQSTNIVDKMEDNNTIKGDSTTHFRKFSSTTKMAMIANEMKKSASAELNKRIIIISQHTNIN